MMCLNLPVFKRWLRGMSRCQWRHGVQEILVFLVQSGVLKLRLKVLPCGAAGSLLWWSQDRVLQRQSRVCKSQCRWNPASLVFLRYILIMSNIRLKCLNFRVNNCSYITVTNTMLSEKLFSKWLLCISSLANIYIIYSVQNFSPFQCSPNNSFLYLFFLCNVLSGSCRCWGITR